MPVGPLPLRQAQGLPMIALSAFCETPETAPDFALTDMKALPSHYRATKDESCSSIVGRRHVNPRVWRQPRSSRMLRPESASSRLRSAAACPADLSNQGLGRLRR